MPKNIRRRRRRGIGLKGTCAMSAKKDILLTAWGRRVRTRAGRQPVEAAAGLSKLGAPKIIAIVMPRLTALQSIGLGLPRRFPVG